MHYFLLGDDTLALMTWMAILQQKTTHKRRENSKLQDLQRQEGGGEYVWNISEQIQGTTGHHAAKAKGCQKTLLWRQRPNPFSGLPNYSKNFYLSWCCSNFQRKSNPFPTSFKTISNHITSPLRLLKSLNTKLCKNVSH